ncbi:MAG: S-layer homology domain-containing protein [Clostridia bacterium]
MKRTVTVFLILAIVFSSVPCFGAGIAQKAEALYDLGLLKGTTGSFSLEGLELDRYATRVEMCVTVVRMLGKEEKAIYQKNPHPFTDVPLWASDYVGWLYENYLVNGVSDTYFGATDYATVQQFATMLMRVLGYSDAKGDFNYNGVSFFAKGKGVITDGSSDVDYLLRSTMIDMCYNALRANLNNSSRTLIAKLCDELAVDSAKASKLSLLKAKTISDAFSELDETLGDIEVFKLRNSYEIVFDDEVEHYGLRVFVMEKGTSNLREVSLSKEDSIYMEKGEVYYYNHDPAGYVSELYVYGLDKSKTYEFIVIKTTSEGKSYLTVGKSGVGEN